MTQGEKSLDLLLNLHQTSRKINPECCIILYDLADLSTNSCLLTFSCLHEQGNISIQLLGLSKVPYTEVFYKGNSLIY